MKCEKIFHLLDLSAKHSLQATLSLSVCFTPLHTVTLNRPIRPADEIYNAKRDASARRCTNSDSFQCSDALCVVSRRTAILSLRDEGKS
jgi:hypothetical protein